MIFESRFTPSIELGLWKFLTLEIAPMFLINDSPVLWDLYGVHIRDESVYRNSDGLGPLLGASASFGIWLRGKPFRGYVLRPFITNYATEYVSKVDGVIIDRETFVERRVGLLFGGMTRFGPLALSGSIGLSYELNPAQGCELRDVGPQYSPGSRECSGRLLIKTERATADLLGPLHPVHIEGRILVGFVVD